MWSVSIDDDIKNNDIKSVYLLCGTEVYLRNQYRDKLINAINAGEMNTTRYFGKGINVGEVIDLAQTMPFLSEKRLIVLDDSTFAKNSCPQLAEYIPSIPASTVLIMLETEVDKRNLVYKAVADKGSVVEFSIPDEEDVKLWIRSKLKKEGKGIANSAMNTLLERAGGDMMRLSSEIEKLVCYTAERSEITFDDVNALCVKQTDIKIFDMVRHVVSGNRKAALAIYYELLAAKEPPMRTLYNLGRQFNQLLTVKQLYGAGRTIAEICAKIKVKEGIAKSILNQAKRFSTAELKGIIGECVELEEAVKTGKLDENMSVELFIIKYSTTT